MERTKEQLEIELVKVEIPECLAQVEETATDSYMNSAGMLRMSIEDLLRQHAKIMALTYKSGDKAALNNALNDMGDSIVALRKILVENCG